jgi:hypothetical protein
MSLVYVFCGITGCPVQNELKAGTDLMVRALGTVDVDFGRPILNLVLKQHLTYLSKPDVSPVIDETKDLHTVGVRTLQH